MKERRLRNYSGLKRLLVLFLFIAVFAAATMPKSSYAFGMMQMGHGKRFEKHFANGFQRRLMFMCMRKMHMMAKKLHISRVQMKKIWKLQRDNIRKTVAIEKSIGSPMMAALKTGAFNEKVFKAVALKKAEIMIDFKAKSLENCFSVLTPVQKKEFIILQKIKMGDWNWLK